MPRTDNDTWDLATSVGATATMVAAARAVATKADNPLINDQFAEPLVRAVGVDFLTDGPPESWTPLTSTTRTPPGSSSRCPTRWPPAPASSTRSSPRRPRPVSARR